MEVTFVARQALTAKIDDLPDVPLAELLDYLKVPNPAYKQAVMFGRRTGSLPPKIPGYELNSATVHIRRGAFKAIKRVFEKHGHTVKIVDERTRGPKIQERCSDVILREYQWEAVQWALKDQQGIIQAPCGSGKTRMGCGLIAAVNQRTIVLVHTKDLMTQWVEDIRCNLGMIPGIVGDGLFEPKEITVVIDKFFTVKRSDRHQARRDLVKDVGLVIVDECHLKHFEVANKIPSQFRIGLTATPTRGDGTTRLMDWTFGDMLVATTHEALVEQDIRIPPEFEELCTNFYHPYSTPEDWPGLLDALCADEQRQRLIAERVLQKQREGRSILVLGGRINHCKDLHRHLLEMGCSSYVLTGEVRSAERKDALDKTRKGEIKVLIATSLGDVGLDVPLLDTLVLTFPSRSKSLTHQRIGRVLRRHSDKHAPLVIDVVDEQVGVLANQAAERQSVYADYAGRKNPGLVT